MINIVSSERQIWPYH